MAAPDGPTAPPESFDNSQDIAPVVATTPATAVVSAPSKRQKEIARRKARAGASGAATKPAPTARNVLPATAKPNPATPEVRVSLDYHSLSPSEKFAAVKSVLSLFVSVLTGWDTRRLGQGRVARDNRDMRNGTLRSFVTNMQMNKPMEAASAMFLLSKHLFTSHEQVASAFRCREIIFIAAKVCMRAWKGRLEQLSHDAGSSDILQALCVSEDELVGALRQLAAESKKRAIEKSGAAKPVTPLQSATITGQTPVEAPVLPDTSIGLPGIDELAKAPVPTDKRRPGELDYDSMSAQERLEAIDTVLSLFVQALRYKPARHERKAREAVLRSLVASLQKKSIPAISNAMLTLSGGVSAHAELRCPGILAVAVTTCGRAWQERVSRLTNNADSPAILSALAADTDELVRVCRGLMAELVSTTDQDGTADAATMVLADAGTIPEVSASEPLVESPAPVAGGTAVEGEPAPAPVATPTDHTAESGRAHIDAMIREICAILRDRSITNSNITKALRAAGISTAQVYDLYSLLHTQKFGTANLVSPKNPGFSRSWKRIENPTGLEACVEELFEDLLRAAA